MGVGRHDLEVNTNLFVLRQKLSGGDHESFRPLTVMQIAERLGLEDEWTRAIADACWV